MAKKRKQYDDDDGRVIANMNVEGMPWYTSPAPGTESGQREGEESSQPLPFSTPPKLTRREEFSIFFASMRAGCLIASVFGVIMLIVVMIFVIGSAL